MECAHPRHTFNNMPEHIADSIFHFPRCFICFIDSPRPSLRPLGGRAAGAAAAGAARGGGGASLPRLTAISRT